MADPSSLDSAVEVVLAALPCSVTLPAGAGKTELIAATSARIAARGGTSLVLTHTHAGVDALRRRIQKFGLRRDQVVVRTIDSWSYDLISHFPDLAQLAVPAAPDWSRAADYHRAAARAVTSRAVGRMLTVSYSALLVDEYQDCLTGQHALATALATVLPTVVLGDPLQSLFNFGRNQPVGWDTDVLPMFPAVELEHRPRRWDSHHPALGAWLVGVRANLSNGEPIDLTSAPVTWVQRRHHATFATTCMAALNLPGSVVVLGQYRNDCVSAAAKLRGRYTVMEAIDEKTTARLAATIDRGDGAEVAQAMLKFAIDSSCGIPAHITAAKRTRLAEGLSFTTTNEELKPTYAAVLRVRSTPTADAVSSALDLLGRLPDVTVHCREAWNEISRSLAAATTDACSVSEALVLTRHHARVVGRRPAGRVVSRPLLVKGLEYDHAIIVNPTGYTAQELYVALTRGSRSVTVISDTAVLPPARMAVRPPHSDIH